MGCTNKVCAGSLMNQAGNARPRTREEILNYAKNFLDQYYTSIKRLNSTSHQQRWNEIVEEVEEKGTYHLKQTELIFGAKLAWRNAPRCIGRIQWSKLQVRNC